ncbi:WD repeat-containing protein 3 [Thrips palmi]|uniref:WD repeat-containing protein 3 n=1 Tax=Thrips palmi TaxID=161013 RepID=A0A6P8ZVX2_THRPL|nr:WD repeat-containing protein 3 [Thrips palmi]XP_034249503.1 WD repeat-containing protein 3 [Thrips palmi]
MVKMGLTKQYLRYTSAGNFNIIASLSCNAVFVVLQGQEGRFVAVGGCEDVIVWDLRLGEKALVIPGEKHEVTFILPSPDKQFLAVGYADGSIRVFELSTTDLVATFSGHRSAINCLAYDENGHRLASGSKDTEIIVWDVVAERGLHRLSGHKGIITQVAFLHDRNILVSSSKDTFVKFWDLDTAHCFKTIVGHRTEVWGLALVKNSKYLVTGSSDSELRMWEIKDGKNSSESTLMARDEDPSDITSDESDVASPIICIKAGSILRAGTGRVVGLTADRDGSVLACFGSDNSLEMFEVRSDEEAKLKMKKRLKKQQKKQLSNPEEFKDTSEPMETIPELDENSSPSLKDEIIRLPVIKYGGKVKSTSLAVGRGQELRVASILNNNRLELHSMSLSAKTTPPHSLRVIENQGHHSEVRNVAFSSDGLAIISGSSEALKIWNRPSLACLRTIKTDYILSACFVPGDRHVLLGMKDGKLLIVDIAAGDILEEIEAHSKELWSISVLPDKRGCVTGGGDNTVKFWQFELIQSSESKAKVLSVLHTRSLKLEESVLCVRVSPNSRLLAVALLDSTVKVFYLDTLKFFLSLYGHKLPVTCMDISSDSTLIVTGSADRNVKIWGLDFGDCHRSLFAHDNTVTGIQFIPDTHQFFSCGKDGRVKQWDADSFERIVTIQGHHGEAWGLSVSFNGQYVVSCGSDRVLRMFTRTEEPLVLEDEREQEREEEDNEAVEQSEETTVEGQSALHLPSKKTVGSEKAAEMLLECLEVGAAYAAELDQHNIAVKNTGKEGVVPPPPAIMVAYNASTPSEFLQEVLARIRPSELEECLLRVPFGSVLQLLPQLITLLEKPQQPHTEIVCRTALFLVRVHHGPIMSTSSLLPTIRHLHMLAASKIAELRDLVGVNLHGFLFLQHEIEAREGVILFTEAAAQRKQRGKKRRGPTKRAILTL